MDQDLTRAQVNRAVETLLGKGVIYTNASKKIVWVNQEVFGEVDPKRLQAIAASVDETKQSVAELEQEVQALKANMKRIAATPANDQLSGELQKLRETIQGKQHS